MSRSIGIFDSGIGGLSILKSLARKAVNENYIYLADNKNCPYGNKSEIEILKLSIKNCEKLIKLNCKMIIVACNTATTNSINILRKQFDVPIIGIEPGIKPAINYTKTKNIGVLATNKTLSSKLFNENLLTNNMNKINIHEQIGHDLVELIENGIESEEKLNEYINKYLKNMIDNKIDCLVLGCTHYNFIENNIKLILGPNIKIIDTVSPVINHVITRLSELNIQNTSTNFGSTIIYYNGNKPNKKYLNPNYKIIFDDF